jgi:hypothetical protein
MAVQMPEARIRDDQERLRVAEAKYREVVAREAKLRPGPLADLINKETGVGADAARLVVMAHHREL